MVLPSTRKSESTSPRHSTPSVPLSAPCWARMHSLQPPPMTWMLSSVCNGFISRLGFLSSSSPEYFSSPTSLKSQMKTWHSKSLRPMSMNRKSHSGNSTNSSTLHWLNSHTPAPKVLFISPQLAIYGLASLLTPVLSSSRHRGLLHQLHS